MKSTKRLDYNSNLP